jgi:hypothetical protein
VYVIHDQTVTWQPALNPNRVILGGQLVAIVLLLTIRAIVQARAARRLGMPAPSRSTSRAWPRRVPLMGRRRPPAGCTQN